MVFQKIIPTDHISIQTDTYVLVRCVHDNIDAIFRNFFIFPYHVFG